MKPAKSELPIRSFPSADAWNRWLASQPDGAAGIWLKIAKKSAQTPSVTKAEAVEAALCHGWIDGQLGSFDADWFLIRFTPRKPKSAWSATNREKAEALIASGRMRRRGMREVELAKADGRWAAAYPGQAKAEAPEDLRAALEARPKAAGLFAELDSANRYAVLYRVHQAKTPEARAKRIESLVAMLGRGETIHPRRASRPRSTARR